MPLAVYGLKATTTNHSRERQARLLILNLVVYFISFPYHRRIKGKIISFMNSKRYRQEIRVNKSDICQVGKMEII